MYEPIAVRTVSRKLPELPLPEADICELSEFCRLGSNRFSLLINSLKRRHLPYKVISIANSCHIALVAPKAEFLDRYYFRITFIAHYDRVTHSPGANDNAAAVFQLLSYWEDTYKKPGHPLAQVLLTDDEELTGGMSVENQGSWHLGRHLRRLGISNILFIVLDMCGIGDTPVWGHNMRKIGTIPLTDALARAHQLIEKCLIRYSNGIDYGVNPEFSDDLGLLFHAYPALHLSLLPRAEAEMLRKKLIPPPLNATMDHLENSWQLRHSLKDSIESLEPHAFNLMRNLLREISLHRFPLHLTSK